MPDRTNSTNNKSVSVQRFPFLRGIIGHDQASPQQTTSQQATVTLSFKCLTRLSQWRASRAVMAPGEKELVQTKDVFKKNELRLTRSLVEFLTSSSLYPRVKRQALSVLPQLCPPPVLPRQCSPASNLSFLQASPQEDSCHTDKWWLRYCQMAMPNSRLS
jgi:hypothetical protein